VCASNRACRTAQVVDLSSASLELHKRVLKALNDCEYDSLRKFLANKKAVKPMFRSFDEMGATPLTVAVQRGDPNVVEALLGAMDGVDVNAPDKYGTTALHIACSAGATKNDRVLEALLAVEGIDVCVRNRDNNTPLHYFCEKYATTNVSSLGMKMIDLGGMPLVLQQNDNNETALHKAMFNSQFRMPMARFLIKATSATTANDDDSERAVVSSS
jgi:ankyrin repeat protein